jgi:salicylate hydroxylase
MNGMAIADTNVNVRPYLAQGAAQAVEDAGTLGILLSNISNKNEIPLALQIYEQVRKGRAESIQIRGRSTGDDLHLPDGPEQEARDARMADPKLLNTKGDIWVDAKARAMFWDFDVEAVAQTAWGERAGNQVNGKL